MHKMIDNVLIENKDYELIPSSGDPNDENWRIRVLNGDFVETIFQFEPLELDEDQHLKYNFRVIQSPSDEAVNENKALQDLVGDVLFSIFNTMEKDNK